MNLTYLTSLANHLWQSTLFAAVAGLLTLALRNNPARVRHWVWFGASCKFLVPLSALIALGGHVRWRIAPAVNQSNVSVVMDKVSEPFSTMAVSSALFAPPSPATSPLPAILLGLWLCGFLGIACSWWIHWLRIRSMVRASSPLGLKIPIPAMSSPSLAEPGVFGVLRPVMLLPAGIFERLTPPQLQAVIAHELCHVGYRDNLLAAIHMFVETLFWFHPLVWWIGKRMVEERERACDEQVLLLGGEPRIYAEGILNVCKLYVESPLACVSGVTGANLKKRIAAIMSNRAARGLNFAQKAGLAVAATGALAMPVVVGALNAPAIRAQSAEWPRFEVASIKRCTFDDVPAGGGGGRGGGGLAGDPGMFRTACVTVRSLVQSAYVRYANGQVQPPDSLKNQPIESAHAWIDSDRYRIEAKPESPQTRAMMGGPMLQALLEDRFKLKVHRRSKEVAVYALVVAKGGARLQATKEGGCTPADQTQGPPPVVPGQPLPCGYIDGREGGIDAVGATMANVCQILAVQLHRAVVDKTGLSGLFNYHLDFNVPPPGAPGDEDQFSTAMEALQKLGLKVEPAKGTAEIIVIDRVERPSEN